MVTNAEQLRKIKTANSFIAALDQSGGSTSKALASYGVGADAWSSDSEMLSIMHDMRARLMTSSSFDSDRVLGAILFADTLKRSVDGRPTADFLWTVKHIVPFLKIDKGLLPEHDGVQLMKPIADLDQVFAEATAGGIFGTKMRSFVKHANPAGIAAIVDEQFELARRIIAAGLVPILEPEIDIHCPDKAAAEQLLKAAILAQLDRLEPGQLVMLKLTLPEQDDFYTDCINHANVLKVLALSGGYSRGEANMRLSRNHRMVASFSRALVEGLTKQQSPEEFDAMLDASIGSIYRASKT